jgi:hypothetical protein
MSKEPDRPFKMEKRMALKGPSNQRGSGDKERKYMEDL